MAAALTTANVKSHCRIYHADDDGYINTILLPAAIRAWEAATGRSAELLIRIARLSEEGTTYWYPTPQPIDSTYTPTISYTDPVNGPTIENATVYYEGGRAVVEIPSQYTRPVTITYRTTGSDDADVMGVLQACAMLYAYRGDDPGSAQERAVSMLTAMFHERGVS